MSKVPARRELDKMIAERVFGLVPCRAHIHKDGSAPWDCHATPEDPKHGGETPLYSSTIERAMEVVGKLLEEKYWMFDLLSTSPGSGMVWFSDTLGRTSQDMGARFASLEELPQAICFAALKKFGEMP